MQSKYETLYEVSQKFEYVPQLIDILIVVCPIILLIVGIIIGFKTKKLFLLLVMALLTVYVFGIIYYVINNMPEYDLDLYSMYADGDYVVCEGIIENYDAISSVVYDSFEVEGYRFIIRHNPTFGYGYTYRQSDGGVLKNGLSVRIYFINHMHENVIMKIEWIPIE